MISLLLGCLPVRAQNANPAADTPGVIIRPSYATRENTARWMESRKNAQLRALPRGQAFHDFQLRDVTEESGITFSHRAVDDAAKSFKLAHYDHGSGLAAADVDGDGLVDLYFVNQVGGNQLWRNRGGGKFENITDRAGVGLPGRICVGAAFADLDNDGKPDLFVTTVRTGNVFFHNLGGGKFENVSKRSGLDYSGHSSGAVFFDFNNDGLLDFFVCNVGVYTSAEKGADGAYKALADAFRGHTMPERFEPSILYLNEGNLRFRDVSREMNLQHKAWSGDASFFDINSDGFPDVYVLNMSGSDSLYENQGGKTFKNRTSSYFPKTPWGAMGLKFFDYDQDGLIDLYVTDMHSDMNPQQNDLGRGNTQLRFEKQRSDVWCNASWGADYLIQDRTNFIFGNALFRNGGRTGWEDISERVNVETYWPWGLSVGDFNADGYDDVFVASGMGYPFRYGINSLLLNDGGRNFFDAEFAIGIEPRKRGPLIEYFTFDCSGQDRDNPLCEGKTGELKVYASTSSRSSLIVDLDNDGDMDLAVNNMNDKAQIHLSNLTEKRKVSFLKVVLQGTRSNRDGLGAIVALYADEKVLTQYHDGKSGYLSQSSLPIYFGLGDSTLISKVKVKWPSGTVQTLKSPISLNTVLSVTEPTDVPR